MTEKGAFELADDPVPEEPPKPSKPQAAPPPPRVVDEPETGSTHEEETPSIAALGHELAESLDERRKKRLLRFVPSMAVAFLIAGWLFVGGAFWVFGLVGAAIGVFAAWRRRGEVLLGTVSAVAGLVTALALGCFVLGLRGVLTIVACGTIGFLAAIDDRLRGG